MSRNSGFGGGRERAKSVFDGGRGRLGDMTRSAHSRSKYDMGSSKHARTDIGITDD